MGSGGQKVTRTLVLSIFAAVLGMFQFGFNTGVINSPQKYIKAFINDSYNERYGKYPYFSEGTVNSLFSIAVCSCLVGGMIGGLTGGAVADKFGRSRGLLYTQFFSILGSILMGICKVCASYELLVLGRFFIGLACGLFTVMSPMYVSEIAPIHIRGGLGTVNQLFVAIGILLSQVFGLESILGSEGDWPLLLALGGAVPSLIQVALLPLSPESPRYVILNRRDEEKGRKSLQKLRGCEDVVDEIADIKSEESGSGSEMETMGVLQLLKTKSLRLPLAICVLIHLSQQLCGIVAVFYYSTDFFVNAGVPEETAPYATMGVGGIMVIMTLVTIPLMDRAGRRTLHLSGLAGMFACSILITVGLPYSSGKIGDNDWANVLIVTATLTFVVFFALGPGSIPWLITSEIFTQSTRPAATAIATLVNWSANLFVGLIFPVLDYNIQNYSFVPFSVIVFILYWLLYIYLPETKGRSVDDISAKLQGPGAKAGIYTSEDRWIKF